MVLHISRAVDAKIKTLFLIFKNGDCNYPIAGVPDNVQGAYYRSVPRGWMDRFLLNEYFKEPRAIERDYNI